MDRLLLPIATALLLLASIAGCTDGDREGAVDDASLAFTDALDRTVRLDRPVERVVSLAPSVTEIVHAAGAFDRLVAVTTADDYPPAVDSLIRISALPVDFEAILLAEADLVLATTQVNSPSDAGTLQSLGVPVYFLSNRTVDEIHRAILDVGTMLETSDAARAAVDSLQRREVRLESLTAGIEERPSVIVLVSAERSYSFGPESYVHDLVWMAGGRSLTENFPTEIPVLEDEYVLEAQPDVILGTFGPDFDVSELLAHHPTWIHTPAVADGRVYSVPSDELLRPGPRVVEAAWQMAAVLHPELFSDSAEDAR